MAHRRICFWAFSVCDPQLCVCVVGGILFATPQTHLPYFYIMIYYVMARALLLESAKLTGGGGGGGGTNGKYPCFYPTSIFLALSGCKLKRPIFVRLINSVDEKILDCAGGNI